jgi:hypothetical protein
MDWVCSSGSGCGGCWLACRDGRADEHPYGPQERRYVAGNTAFSLSLSLCARMRCICAGLIARVSDIENGEWIVDFNSYDLTTVIAFIKYYLTEQPLISEEIYNGLSAAIGAARTHARTVRHKLMLLLLLLLLVVTEIQFQSFRQNEIHSLLSRLPHINLCLLRRILEFLAVISKNVEHKLTIGRGAAFALAPFLRPNEALTMILFLRVTLVATCFATVLLQPSHLDVQDIKVQRKDISLLRELIMNYDGLFTANQQLQFIERYPHLFASSSFFFRFLRSL